MKESNLIKQIQRRLDLLGLRPQPVSLVIGSNPTLIRDILIGKSKSPSYDTIVKIAEQLRGTAEDLQSPHLPESLDDLLDAPEPSLAGQKQRTMLSTETVRDVLEYLAVRTDVIDAQPQAFAEVVVDLCNWAMDHEEDDAFSDEGFASVVDFATHKLQAKARG